MVTVVSISTDAALTGALVLVGFAAIGAAWWYAGQSGRDRRREEAALADAIGRWHAGGPHDRGIELLSDVIRCGHSTLAVRPEWLSLVIGVLDSDPDPRKRALAAAGLANIYARADLGLNMDAVATATQVLARRYPVEQDESVRIAIVKSLASYHADVANLVRGDASADVRLAFVDNFIFDEDFDVEFVPVYTLFLDDPDPRVAQSAQEWLGEANARK